jgi:protein-tyrosine phosphatase
MSKPIQLLSPKSVAFSNDEQDEEQRQKPTGTRSNIVNFRDLGGHVGHIGARVRTAMIYRSATLSHANEADLNALRHLRIRSVIDLRTEHEQLTDGVVPASLGATLHTIPLINSLWKPAGTEDPIAYLADRYVEMIDEGAPGIVAAIDTIVREPGPALFHCMAGKDRTGLLAASVLHLLGVDDEVILADYAKSEQAMTALREMFLNRFPDRKDEILAQPTLFNVAPRSALVGAMSHAQAAHGSIEHLLRAHGLTSGTIFALRVLLLHR